VRVLEEEAVEAFADADDNYACFTYTSKKNTPSIQKKQL
jgi:hypothetical protein